MPRIDLEAMPDDARLWVFGAERTLDEEERAALLARVDGFLEEWKAHGRPLSAARDLRHDRFLLVAVDPASEPPSGCSIDAMVRLLKEVGRELDVALVDHAPVFYRDAEGRVVRASRAEFRRSAEAGAVSPGTPVFDNTVTRLSQLREGAWERPASAAWHGRVFWKD